MAACLPPGPAGLSRGRQLPARPPLPARQAAQRGGRRLVADLRSGRALLAAELSRPGWLDFGAFRWRDLAVGQAVRATLGVLTPLAVGIATSRVEYGSFAALGALPAGFVAFRGVNRTRAVAILCAAVGMAFSTFAGATAAHHPWLLVPLVLAWAYGTGLLAVLGPTVLAVTLQWPVALLVGSALPLSLADAGIRAGLVLAGGLWQCLLVISSWTLNRGSAERSALAATYSELAGYASRLASGQLGPPDPTQLPASNALADPNPLLRTAARQHMLDLADEAVRIRTTLAALSVAADAGGPSPLAVRGLLGVAAGALAELAAELDARSGRRDDHLTAASRELDGLVIDPGTAWRWAAEALLGQLRTACRIVTRLNDVEPARGRAAPPRPVRQAWRSDVVLTLRASIGTSSEAGRHALRLAAATATAATIAQASGLSHGYWAVLTVFIVLRPDYSSTLYRGLQRAAGTVLGAGLGVATVQLARLGMAALLIGIGVSLLAAYAVFTVNYLLYGVFLTDFVVVLLALLGLPAESTAVARLIGTGLGTGLAIVAYLLWPTWEGTSSAEKFARLFLAQGSYASTLLRAYTRPRGPDAAVIRQLRVEARRARLNAEASADRLAGEPDHPPMTAQTARALESAGHRVAQACLTLGAVVTAHQTARPADASLEERFRPGLDRLASATSRAMSQIAAALRAAGQDGPHPPASLPPLRQLQQEIWQEQPDREPADNEVHGLLAATDSLVDAVNTTAHALGAGRTRGPGAS